MPSLPAPAGSRACRTLPPEGAPRRTWRPPNLVPAQPRVAAEKARPQTQIVYTRALQDLASWLRVDCLPHLDKNGSVDKITRLQLLCRNFVAAPSTIVMFEIVWAVTERTIHANAPSTPTSSN